MADRNMFEQKLNMAASAVGINKADRLLAILEIRYCMLIQILRFMLYNHCFFVRLHAPIARLAKGRLSAAGGPRFESQTGRVMGKPLPSLWRDKHPAIKGLQPPEQHAGHSNRTKQTPPSQTKNRLTGWR